MSQSLREKLTKLEGKIDKAEGKWQECLEDFRMAVKEGKPEHVQRSLKEAMVSAAEELAALRHREEKMEEDMGYISGMVTVGKAGTHEGNEHLRDIILSLSNQQKEMYSSIPSYIADAMKEAVESTKDISNASTKWVNSLLSDLGIFARTCPEAISKDLHVTNTKPFSWDDAKEDNAVSRSKYIQYLSEILLGPGRENIFVVDVAEGTDFIDLLSTDFGEKRVKGNADVIISSESHTELMMENAHLVFELKKPAKKIGKLKQAHLRLLAADRISGYNIILVCTDLNDSWTINWIEKSVNPAKGKLCTICVSELDRGTAVGFLRYHLKTMSNMLKSFDDIIEFKHDEDYDDAKLDPPTKRQKCIAKSRPTFLSTTAKNVRSLMLSGEERHMDLTADEMADQLIRNFTYTNRRYLGDELQLKSTDVPKKVDRSESESALKDWLKEQEGQMYDNLVE